GDAGLIEELLEFLGREETAGVVSCDETQPFEMLRIGYASGALVASGVRALPFRVGTGVEDLAARVGVGFFEVLKRRVHGGVGLCHEDGGFRTSRMEGDRAA